MIHYLLPFLLVIYSSTTFSQSTPDHHLYSLAIKNDLTFWDPEGDSIKGVIVIKNTDSYSLQSNWDLLKEYSSELNSDHSIQYNSVGLYKENIIRFKENPELSILIKKLSSSFTEEPVIQPVEFDVKILIEFVEEEQYLSKVKRKNFWKHFYKMYPNYHGYYSFSKVVYEGNFAAFYVGHLWGKLAGSGDVIYLHKEGEKWMIFAVQNLWSS